MTTDRWQRTHELFDEALRRAPEERAAFLATACTDDAELKVEVESLLNHDRRVPEDFLQTPVPASLIESHPVDKVGQAPVDKVGQASVPAGAGRDAGPTDLFSNPPTHFVADAASALKPGAPNDGAPADDVAATETCDPLIGQHVGAYHVKSVIAAGGMATVYEAVQSQPHRVVALKVMNRHTLSRSALRRFQFEAQILGRLRHPNIAQVYEAGTHRLESGATTPYFALEYIPGARTITEYVGEHNLDVRARLALFVKVCEAIHHGHQKGIVHRDIKPANILVDSAGEPKVIDFGVARATDSDMALTTQQTCIGQLVGTMQYMSPEQCDADPHDLDTRSDVYSLGVVLYELLAGRLPYDASTTTVYAATRIIKEQAPQRPSTISGPDGRPARQLRGDVETIVLKALEKDREKRYPSAADLAQDIRRYLTHEPIEARRPTAWTRAARWVVRHPVITTAAACFLVGALTTTATATLGNWYLNWRAYDVVASSNKREARLVSFAGNVLRTWTAPDGNQVGFARLVDRHRELGGGKLALVGFAGDRDSALGGKLCAFELAGDLSRPKWAVAVEDGDLTPKLRDGGAKGEQWHFKCAIVGDVFPEPGEPGQEIVAIFNRASSERIIRVYNMHGDLRYQAWHDGTLADLCWLPGPRLLILAGSDQSKYVNGGPPDEQPDPRIVFALRPVPGEGSPDYVLGEKPDRAVKPVWCLRAKPETFFAAVHEWRLSPVPEASGPPQKFELTVSFDDETRIAPRTCSWVIDECGKLMGVPGLNDAYKANQLPTTPDAERLPDPNDVKFVPWPGTTAAASAPAGDR